MNTVKYVLIGLMACFTGCEVDQASISLKPSEHSAEQPIDICTCERHVGESLLANGEAKKPYQLHDLQLVRRIELAASQMIAKKATTKASDLRKQLTNSKCKVDRPAPKPGGTTSTTLYDQHRSSVLVMAGIFKCGKCSRWHARPASGFVISEDGKAVTNYHVMAGGNDETYVALTGDGKVFPVKAVLAASEANDLAIVQLDVGDTKLKALALSPNAPVGSDVFLISHPDRRFYTLSRGIVSRYFLMDKPKAKAKNVPMMTITADFAKGSSGAPVLNEHAHVTGVVSSTVSVYYNAKDGIPRNLQTVFKQCVPTASLLKLIE